MGKKLISDFVVDMNSHCFLCLEGIVAEQSEADAIHSLHHLSRYLKLNFAKVFDGKGGVPPRFLATMERSRLKVTLCGGCATLTEKFSVLCHQLEKTEMEVHSCLNIIHEKLLDADKSGRIRQYMTGSKNKTDVIGNLEIVEGLRKEAEQKCWIKLRNVTPRVAIQDFSRKTVNAEKLKAKVTDINRKVTREKSNCKIFTQAAVEAYLPDQNVAVGSVEIERTEEAVMVEGNFEVYNYELDPGPILELGPAQDNQSYRDFIYDQNDYEYDYQEPEEGIMETPEDHPLAPGGPPNSPPSTDDYWQPKSIFDPATRKHKCGLCSREYKHERSFQDHYRGDHLQQKFGCQICGREFTFRQNYHKHLRSANHKSVTGSETRDREEGTDSNLTTQKGFVTGSKTIEKQGRTAPKANATANGDKSPTRTDYSFEVINSHKKVIRGGKQHYTLNPNTGKVKCNECSMDFKLKASFQRHYNDIHLKVRYRCNLCMKEFSRRDNYFTHHEGVHMGRRYKCRKCSKLFKVKSELQQHERKNTCRPAWRQPPLERRKLLVRLRKQKSTSSKKDRKYRCHICALQFVTKKQLKGHLMAMHPQEMEINCDLCGKKFSRKDHLARHRLSVHHKTSKGV